MVHQHKCDKCGAVWEHPDKCMDSRKDHECPRCQQVNYYKYTEDEVLKSDYIYKSPGVYKDRVNRRSF